MIAICIESSHQRGMGHFYRALTIRNYLKEKHEECILLINKDKVSNQILDREKIPYEIVDYQDVISNWEQKIIKMYQINIWLLDKYETQIELTSHVKQEGVLLAAIDDCGEGAVLVDLHFCSMLLKNQKGKHIFSGKEYLILNPEIKRYQRRRENLGKVLVTLGGSDTYGVTIEVVKILKKHGYPAEILIGPSFQHRELLDREASSYYPIFEAVPSLIQFFYSYDLAITGGGVTCFEANASGLPCIVIANELHEIETGRYIEQFGGAVFAGYYKEIEEKVFDLDMLSIKKMSIAAMQAFSLTGLDQIYNKIQKYKQEKI